jgi:hypothetical protein
MRIRHRLANYFLLMVFKLCHVRMVRRAAARVAKVIQGPLDPERLYAKAPVMEQRLMRAKPLKNARPDVSHLGELVGPQELEKWLAEEASAHSSSS